MKISRIKKALGVVALVGLATTFSGQQAGAAPAATDQPIDIQATVLAACTIVPAAVNFGQVDVTGTGPIAADVDGAHGSVEVNCPAGIGWNLYMDQGNAAAATGRYMQGPAAGDQLPYELTFGNVASAGGTNIGDTLATGLAGSGPATGAGAVVVYGEIPATGPWAIGAGAYSDQLNVNLDF